MFNQLNAFQVGVGSFFLVSPGKNSTITFQQIVIQVVWKNSRPAPLLGSVFRPWHNFLANNYNNSNFREPVFLLAALC